MKRILLAGIITLLLTHYPAWAEPANNGIKVGGDLNITTTDNGKTEISIDNRKVYELGAEALQALEQQGIAKVAVNNFFKILYQEKIPTEDWDSKLREIAEDYKNLKEQVSHIQTNSIQGETLKTEAEQAIENGEFDNAEELFNEIHQLNMQAAAQNILFAAEADAANGALASTQLKYKKSGEYYQRAAQSITAIGNENTDLLIDYLNKAGEAFSNAGYLDQALVNYQKSFELTIDNFPDDYLSISNRINSLALLYKKKGQYEEALTYYELALDVLDNASCDCEHHEYLSSILNNIAALYITTEQIDDAILILGRSLSIAKEIYDANDPQVALLYDNLGHAFRLKGLYNVALPLHNHALNLFRTAHTSNPSDIAICLLNIGALYQDKEEYEQALEFNQKSLEILETALGREHPLIASTLKNIATIHILTQDNDRALTLLRDVLSIQEKTIGLDHPETIDTLFGIETLESRLSK